MQSSMNHSFACNCLPGCFEITYDAEVSIAPLHSNQKLLKNTTLKEQNVTTMHIFYKNMYFRSQRKEEIIGLTEFLCTLCFWFEFHLIQNYWFVLFITANSGGLLGLFMGFSFFSIVEIVYFLTFRPCMNQIKVSKKRRQTNRMSKKLNRNRLQSRVHWEMPENNSVYPYIDWIKKFDIISNKQTNKIIWVLSWANVEILWLF